MDDSRSSTCKRREQHAGRRRGRSGSPTSATEKAHAASQLERPSRSQRRHLGRRLAPLCCSVAVVLASADSQAQLHRLPDGDCPRLEVPGVEKWTRNEEGGREHAAAYDLDQDGTKETRISLLHSSGSGFGGIELVLDIDGQEPMEVSEITSFAHMVNETLIPERLLLPENLCLLRLVESGLFHKPLGETIDPSLRWLLDAYGWLEDAENPAWIPGPPTMPGHAVLRLELPEGPAWVRYAGHMHGTTSSLHAKWMEGVDSLPHEMARDGSRVLLATAHGLILTDPERLRHRWLFVYPGGQKLRWPSIQAARFEGEAVIVSLPAESTAGPPVEISIALESGAVAWEQGSGARLYAPRD